MAVEEDKSSEDEEEVVVTLDDSSEYSDEQPEEVDSAEKYPFVEKEPSVRDFFLY